MLRKIRTALRYLLRLFSLEKNQSPLIFHGLLCFCWRLTDFIPGRMGIASRWLIGSLRFKKLGKFPHIGSHNTFFDGRETEIGNFFYAGQFNYFAGGPIKIGDNVSLANYVIIETTGHYIDDLDKPIHKQGVYRLPVVIGDNVWIGNRATILGGVTIGEGAVIGAGSVVTKDVPPNAVVAGNPARVIRWRGDKDSQEQKQE